MRNSSLFHVFFSFALGLLTGCVNTEGTLYLKGKVVDSKTNRMLPGRDIIVKGLLYNSDEEEIDIEAGQFTSDSSGFFTFTLRKIKDVRYYNFSVVGDSNYSYVTARFGLLELKQNAKYLTFGLSRLTDLKIIINNAVKSPYCDTLYLSWESNGIDFRILYPYEIIYYGRNDNCVGVTPYSGIKWIGANTSSTIKAKVIADKITRLHWEVIRNKKRKIATDTITCRRDLTNTIYFTY